MTCKLTDHVFFLQMVYYHYFFILLLLLLLFGLRAGLSEIDDTIIIECRINSVNCNTVHD